jgi:hypothetical protein
LFAIFLPLSLKIDYKVTQWLCVETGMDDVFSDGIGWNKKIFAASQNIDHLMFKG